MTSFRTKRSQLTVVAAALLSLTSVMVAAPTGLTELVRDAELVAMVKVLAMDKNQA